MKKAICASIVFVAALVSQGRADIISLGVLSFDSIIAGAPGSPGVNAFTIGNLTGDPAHGGFALPSDFPVLTSVSFLNGTLTLTTGSTQQVLQLGDVGPGFFSPTALQFPDTAHFASAAFSATLNPGTLQLSGASGTFKLDTLSLSAKLLPASGSNLVAGTDFIVLTASGATVTNPVPEPSTFVPLLVGFVLVLLGSKWLKRTTLLLACAIVSLRAQVVLAPTTSPGAGQPGVSTISVTGSQFPAGTIKPTEISVELKPATAGASVTTPATAVTTITGSTRRVTFVIPSSVTVATPTAYLVSISGKIASSNTAKLLVNPAARILSLSPTSANAGESVPVTIAGSFTNFVQGSTRASFGAGISVGAITVTSTTTATAQLGVDAAAKAGARTVTVMTGSQEESLPNGFSIATSTGGLPPDPKTVAPRLDNSVATTIGASTAFLYSGAHPIQTGVAPNTIVPVRAAVVRGRILDSTNAPLPGVTITFLNHPEFGQTLSRADGMFDMAVNGGGLLNVNYEKSGLLSAQRQLQVPWHDFVLAPNVILIPRDNHVTTVQLTRLATIQLGEPGRPTLVVNPTQVARGSIVTDSDGRRQATLIFQPRTQATMVMPDGSSQSLSTLHVRATEYTVGPNGPSAMPAELPPTSAYTYAVELSADEAIAAGATSLSFDRPVILYTENFLRFPVGQSVPEGYYDRVRGTWIPSESGLVLKVLSVTGGLANLDISGNGQPADATALASVGITDSELAQLGSLYSAGQSLWRAPVMHFSSWDSNWGWEPPPDASGPNGGGGGGPDPKPDDPCETSGSIIQCESQVLGETVGLAGTPFNLTYRSDRVSGRKAAHVLTIPLSGTSVPASLKRIDFEIDVAAQQFQKSFPPTANQTTTFVWDGKDAYGRSVQGVQPATVTIGFVYGGVYQSTSKFGYNGNGLTITGNRTRQEVTILQVRQVSLGSFVAQPEGLGGWNLSIHHAYDGQTLYLGDGRTRSAATLGTAVTTSVAGTEGGPAYNAIPGGIAVGPDGSLYITDMYDNRVRRVDRNGTIITVAGTGEPGERGFDGDGGPATEAHLYEPAGVVAASDGSLYISDSGNGRVRRVDPRGIITTVAGNGQVFPSGDGGPATKASLVTPYGVAMARDGSLYISEGARVRRVDRSGTISTVAGGGSGGDGGPAIQARLVTPYGIAIGADGSLYIADATDCRVRRVDRSGIITTVAGNGQPSFSGDGGPASRASLFAPHGVAIGADGSVYIADTTNNRVRVVNPRGIITTIAGNGEAGIGGEGGPATQAQFGGADIVAVAPDGSIYISAGRRVHRVASVLPGLSASDIYVAATDGREIYVFNSAGKHLRTIDAFTGGVRYQFVYDSSGRPAKITDGDGNVTTIQHDASENPTAIIAPFGQRTVLAVDDNGFLNSITNPAGETFLANYTADGLLMLFRDPNGNNSSMTYDPSGRLARDSDAAGGSVTLERTGTDESYTVSVSTALGRTTDYETQHLTTGDEQRITTLPDRTQTQYITGADGSRETLRADGTAITFTQGPDPLFSMQAPLPKSIDTSIKGLTSTLTNQRTAVLADPLNILSLKALTNTITINGRTSNASFDTATKTISATTATGRENTTTIDGLSRITQAQMSGLFPANLAYDIHGRLTTITKGTGADSRTAAFRYDSNGFLEAVTDPLGHSLRFQYDAAGRVTRSILPDGREITYEYDAAGNLVSYKPPGRPPYAFSYTPVSLTSRYAPPLVTGAGATVYTYNIDRQLTLVNRPDNKTVSVSYDSSGRLSSETIPRGVYTFTYDGTSGHLSRIDAPDAGALVFTYNGALLTETTWTGTVTGTITRAYDNDFRVATLIVNDTPVAFTYDGDGLLIQAGSLSITRSSQQNGLIIGTTLGNLTEGINHNGFGEVTSSMASYNALSLLSERYTRDRLGRVVQKVETIAGRTKVIRYTYDLVGRLSQVMGDGVTVATYSYDDNSNLIAVNRGGVVVNGTYDAQDRLSRYGNTVYGYTANGELESKNVGGQTTSYSYDEFGNLFRVRLPAHPTIEYVIDGQNRRIGKKVGGELVQGFLYQTRINPVAELDGQNTVVSRFVYGSRRNVPDYMVKNGITYRILTDQTGSPRLVVDVESGSVAERLDYDEFGRVIVDTNPGFQPFGFAGGLYDRDTQLVRFGARDFDPEARRWTTQDPIGFGGGQNLYVYVNNDPINLIDPSGLIVELCTRVADIPVGRDVGLTHHWIRTSSKEAGLGPAGGGVPGVGPDAQADSPYVTQTSINDHTGQGDAPGATCHEVHDVDEECVNRELSIGQSEGRWTPANQCWSAAEDILYKCRKREPYRLPRFVYWLFFPWDILL